MAILCLYCTPKKERGAAELSEQESQLDLAELHECELEILKYFRDLCGKHGLQYFITAGTLLGAVRHGGFIPWDDDVDVVMPRKDYNRLAKIMRSCPDADYCYQDGRSDKMYPFYFAKLRSNRYHVYEEIFEGSGINNGCYIDIFPLDRCPKNEKVARIYFKFNLFFTTALMKKINPNYPIGYKKKLVIILLDTVTRFPCGLIKFFREAARKTVVGKRLCTIGGAHGYPKESYDREWFASAEPIEFEGEKFSAPVGWKYLLENMYGDYMTYPDEKERRGHFIKIVKEEK